MKRIKGALPVYVLSASLVISSLIYANTAQSATQYVPMDTFLQSVKQLATYTGELQGRVTRLENCLRKGLYVHGQYASC